MVKFTLYIVMALLLVSLAEAATINGVIYSFDLEKRNNTIVTVNSIPPQTKVSKDGTYSFDLEPGDYTIKASYSESNEVKESAIENIKITKQGSFVLDLILFPDFEEEEELLKDTEEEVVGDEYFKTEVSYFDIIISIIAILGFALIIFLTIKHKKAIKEVKLEVKKPEVSDLADRVLDFIKEQEGRTTQKDIRKKFPLSEAKISLVISELENKEIIKRIKKGRGNIIIIR